MSRLKNWLRHVGEFEINPTAMVVLYHVIRIENSSAVHVFDSLTKRSALRHWRNEESDDPKLGEIARFQFTNELDMEMRLTEFMPGYRIMGQCIDGNLEWLGTTVAFELEEIDNDVLLRLYHSGWEEISEFFGQCNYYWATFLQNFKAGFNGMCRFRSMYSTAG